MRKRWTRKRDDGGSMLATVIVIFGGAALCGLITLMDAKQSDWVFWGVIASAFLFVAFIIRLRYSNGNSRSNLGFWSSVKHNPADDGIAGQYRPRRVKTRANEVRTGTQQPITAQEAREIKDSSANTWVPSRDRSNG